MFEMLDVESRTEAIVDGVVIRLAGDIDLTRSASLGAELGRLQRDNPNRLVIDFSEVQTIDSSVVATIVDTLRVSRRRGGLLLLTGMPAYVRGVFEVTGLADGPFDIEETIADAIARPHRRRFDRFTVRNLTCNRGTVLDLSTGGIRLRSRRRLRGEVRVILRGGTKRVDVDTKVCWTHRLGFCRHEAGLEFIDPPRDAVELVESLVAEARERATRERMA